MLVKCTSLILNYGLGRLIGCLNMSKGFFLGGGVKCEFCFPGVICTTCEL